jgi:3',5'-cyclic AMP phosphodiesterase CpdA
MTKFSRREFLGLAGALGLGWCAWGSDKKIDPKGFSIAAINDIHVVDAPTTALLDKAVERINLLPDVRLTVILGDITEDGKREEFELAKKALDRLTRPYMAVPGNHDVLGQGFRAYANYRKDFRETRWVRQEEGWFLIGIDSCEGRAGDVKIPLGQITWLSDRLQEIPVDRPIALFDHHPFNPHAFRYRVRNADKVLALFSKHCLKLVASGHWHGNQVETQHGTLFTTTACCSTTRDNHDLTPGKGFRLFHFEKDTVETEFIEIEGLIGFFNHIERSILR